MSFADSLGERRFVSQYSIEPVGLDIRIAGEPGDPDNNEVVVKMMSLDESVTYFNREANRLDVGSYQATISSVETATPGIYKIVWEYEIDEALQIFVGLIEVGEASAAYDRLSIGFKGIVESAWLRFADLFDSPDGGPHLQVYFQTRFGRGRMAQLLQIAVNRLNTVAQPRTTYSIDEELKPFPYAQWGGLLDQALYIEAIKHLRRSYVEQPESIGVNVARLDRRDYLQRWGEILRDEEEDFKSSLDTFKMAHMGLGRPSILVSGGVYGNFGPTRLPGSAAARPRFWARFY